MERSPRVLQMETQKFEEKKNPKKFEATSLPALAE